MWLSKHKNKYIVYGSDGRVLIITQYKNIAMKIIEEYKHDGENSKDRANT